MNLLSKPESPALIVCFGVSGSGKTTLAQFIAEQFQLNFVEADDFHPDENKAHMRSGKPLTDDMREPWISALCKHLHTQFELEHSCVMANSGLRRAHRQRFRELGFQTLFLHLMAPRDVIRKRIESRTDHYMPPDLLDSQFSAFELPEGEPDVFAVDVSESLPQVATRVQQLVREFFRHSSPTDKS